MSDDYRRLPVHNSACNEYYFAVQDCEKNSNFFEKIVGGCTEVHVALQRCIRQNKKDLAAANQLESEKKHKLLKEKLKNNPDQFKED